MSDISANNKRIAKNTLMLYARMFFVMLVSLYTVRIVLQVLGEVDYGIYSVVGGVIFMFSFLSTTLSSASQRYFAYELGKNDLLQLNKVFNITVLLYVIIIAVVILLAETIGLWFLHTQLKIPEERMFAVDWVYQFTIISFCFGLFTTPFQALIISHEKMNVYAVVGVLEAVLNLLFVVSLRYVSVDKLIVYGALMLAKIGITNVIYIVYSRKKFDKISFALVWDKSLAKEILFYSGWNLYGGVANVIRSHGINILINTFFNPAINAARGIAYQVNGALNSFALNFYTAVRPQVTKYYAQNDREATLNLVFSSSKLSFYLILFLAVPIMVYATPILELWLGNVPKYTELFLRLVIIIAMVDSLSNPLMTLVQATGKVKKYQFVIGSLLLLNLPVSWLFLHYGYSAEYTMYVAVGISVISLFARLFMLKTLVDFPVKEYCISILFRSVIVFSMSLVLALAFRPFFPINNGGFVYLILGLSITVMLSLFAIYFIGLSKTEQKSVVIIIKQKILKK